MNLARRDSWIYVLTLVLCVVLGAAVAAGVDAFADGDESKRGVLYAVAALLAACGIGALLYWQRRTLLPRAGGAPMDAGAHALFAREREDHARMWALLSTMDIGIVFLSNEERVIYCNPAFLRIWRVPPGPGVIGAGIDELLAVTGCTLARPTDQSRYVLRAPQEGETDVKLDLPLADGRLVTQQSHAVYDAAGRAIGRMWVLEDVTTERRNATELLQLAERDALTGLHNRHRFNEEIARMTADAQRNGSRVALFFFDLDGFKHVNDTFGHRAGDATLIRVANEVASQVRRNEIFARLGGDEFAILAPDTPDDVLKVLAERITRSIAALRIEFEGQHMQVTCSCGIAVYPDHAADSDRLFECADAAMYEAKEAGKNAWRLYRSSGVPGLAIAPMSPEGRVRRALDENLLVLHFQGVFAPGAGKGSAPHHYEVLLRVRDPEQPDTLLLPAELIALAEKSDTINEIDRHVLAEAIRKLAREPAIPALAVNISGRSLDDAKLPVFIADTLQIHRVAAQRLKIELTETAAVSDLHDARQFIDAVHKLGCGVSLDDFGTGFSSFAYLKHLHVDAIKIDGLFIRELPSDRQNQLFVQAIVSVARGLHKVTIAECVEDAETLSILAGLGVDYVQGFYLQQPVTGDLSKIE